MDKEKLRKENEINDAITVIEWMKDRINELESENEKLEDSNNEWATLMQGKLKDIESLEEENKNLQDTVDALRDKNLGLMDRVDDLEEENKTLQHNWEVEEGLRKGYEIDIQRLDSRIQDMEAQLENVVQRGE